MAASGNASGVFVLHLQGENDFLAARRVRHDLSAALGSASALIVDLTDATSLDPAVLALLVEGIARCEEQERPCVLLVPDGCSELVRRRLDRRGLSSLLPVARSWDEALRRARPRPAAVLPRRPQPAEPGWTSPVS